ncbi:hypothetical protein LUZ60_006497 [Juncus effusus]|nr:hypothetical protein LUZ60_006497 [Juncus effusus]
METRGWQELGVVDTIYEDDQEEDEDCSNSHSQCSSAAGSLSGRSDLSPPTTLRGIVEAWSSEKGCRPDIIVRVEDQCLRLHKDPVIFRSSYLKRQLTDSSDITIILPSGLTADAFSLAIMSCYNGEVRLTSPNLASVRAMAEWLELSNNTSSFMDLISLTEDYFFQEVSTDSSQTVEVLRSCVKLFGGDVASIGVAIFVRCVEVLAGSGGAGDEWLNEVTALSGEEMQAVAEEMRERSLHDHDLLYRIVDHYLENHDGKLTEEDKNKLCYTITCASLSPPIFMHLVQNPRLPLRFVVQAMLLDQLHSHHSLFHHSTMAPPLKPPRPPLPPQVAAESAQTLGSILQQGAVIRQSAHLRKSMEATSFRIESLERELAGLKRTLRRSGDVVALTTAIARSESFRTASENTLKSSGGGEGKAFFGSRFIRGFKSFFKKSVGTAGECRRLGVVEESSCGLHRKE